MGVGRARLLGAVVGLAALLAPASAARAGGSIAVAPAGDAIEDLSAAIVTRFEVDAAGTYDLEWHVHDERGTCAATPAADDGWRIRSRGLEPLTEAGDTWTIYRTFPDAGRYLICAWATPAAGGEPLAGRAMMTVREPRAALVVAAPARAWRGRPFTVRLWAASQAWRMAFVAVNPAAMPCASSASAAGALHWALPPGFVRGAYTDTATLSLRRPGLYRLCGWLQEDPIDRAPERRVERLIRVVRGAAAAGVTGLSGPARKSDHVPAARRRPWRRPRSGQWRCHCTLPASLPRTTTYPPDTWPDLRAEPPSARRRPRPRPLT